MSADEIRMLAKDNINAGILCADGNIVAALLDFAAMVERCNEVNHDLVRDISAMNGYPLNMDAKDFVENLNYILSGDAGKEER